MTGQAGTIPSTVTGNANNFGLAGLVLVSGGSGYTSAPTVSFSSGTATATAAPTEVVLAADSSVGGSGNLSIPIVTGGFGFTKVGTGSVTLTGPSTYSGSTTVSAGTLLVNGSDASPTINVALGATLGGNGTIAGSVSAAGAVTAGPTAALGSVGTLTTGSLTLGSTLSLDLLSSTNADQIIASSVTLTGTTLALNVGTIVANQQYTILKITGGAMASGNFVNLAEGQTLTVGGAQFKISYVGGTGHDVVLTALTGSTVSPSIVSTILNQGNTYLNSTLVPAQHSMVESVVYSFSSAVSLSAGNFSIIGLPGSGTTVVPTLNVTGSGTVWTVTFSGAGVNPTTNSIGDGEYRLSLTGVSGLADSTYDFFRLLGDMDGTGLVNIADFNTVVGTFLRATNDPAYLGAADLDGDNSVGIADINLLIGNFLHSVPQPLPN